MEHDVELPFGLTQSDLIALVLGMALAVSALLALMIISDLVSGRRVGPRAARLDPAAAAQAYGAQGLQPGQAAAQPQPRSQDLASAIGLDSILVRSAREAVVDGLRRGLVRVELASDRCEGRVAIDPARGKLLCIEEGRVRGLDEEPAGEYVEAG